ncbi:MAG: argininosuccinate lyase [Planctomycetota bacterium]|nr:argininosuccinate lyase [Planctomycetota bacterium]
MCWANGVVDSFQQSFSVDKRLSEEDITGTIAYVEALYRAGILSMREILSIKKGLLRMKKKSFPDGYKAEDIHTAVETGLTKLVGGVAGKIHTGRSRNEQIVTDERMYLKKEILFVQKEMQGLQREIISKAEKWHKVIMPGYTHLQQAQPILFSFYLMSWFFALERDKKRLSDCYKRVDICPLGSGALAGNTYKLNRDKLARKLGFSKVSENALDAVSDRDFIIEFLSDAAILMSHLSRFCEDLIIWSSAEFGFIRIDEGLGTSSSLMPQKHNPDALELIRGKTGRVYGNLFNLLTVMKGLPMGYNKDMQEDKPPMFDTAEIAKECLKVFTLTVKTMKVFPERMKEVMSEVSLLGRPGAIPLRRDGGKNYLQACCTLNGFLKV